MWTLRAQDGTDAVYYINARQADWTLGRFHKNSPNDITISRAGEGALLFIGRKHCQLNVQPINPLEKENDSDFRTDLFVSDPFMLDGAEVKSKTGTQVNKVKTKGRVQLCPGDVLTLGSGPETHIDFRVEYIAFTVCFSNMRNQAQKQVAMTESIRMIGGKVVETCTTEVTHMVCPNIKITEKVIQALLVGAHIVLPEWIHAVTAMKSEEPLPDPAKFIPSVEKNEMKKVPSSSSFARDETRAVLFKDIHFVFGSNNDPNKEFVLLAGAEMSTIRDRGVNMDKLSQNPNVRVVKDAPNPAGKLGIMKRKLKKFKRRLINNEEITRAIILCSTERYCNPIAPEPNPEGDTMQASRPCHANTLSSPPSRREVRDEVIDVDSFISRIPETQLDKSSIDACMALRIPETLPEDKNVIDLESDPKSKLETKQGPESEPTPERRTRASTRHTAEKAKSSNKTKNSAEKGTENAAETKRTPLGRGRKRVHSEAEEEVFPEGDPSETARGASALTSPPPNKAQKRNTREQSGGDEDISKATATEDADLLANETEEKAHPAATAKPDRTTAGMVEVGGPLYIKDLTKLLQISIPNHYPKLTVDTSKKEARRSASPPPQFFAPLAKSDFDNFVVPEPTLRLNIDCQNNSTTHAPGRAKPLSHSRTKIKSKPSVLDRIVDMSSELSHYEPYVAAVIQSVAMGDIPASQPMQHSQAPAEDVGASTQRRDGSRRAVLTEFAPFQPTNTSPFALPELPKGTGHNMQDGTGVGTTAQNTAKGKHNITKKKQSGGSEAVANMNIDAADIRDSVLKGGVVEDEFETLANNCWRREKTVVPSDHDTLALSMANRYYIYQTIPGNVNNDSGVKVFKKQSVAKWDRGQAHVVPHNAHVPEYDTEMLDDDTHEPTHVNHHPPEPIPVPKNVEDPWDDEGEGEGVDMGEGVTNGSSRADVAVDDSLDRNRADMRAAMAAHTATSSRAKKSNPFLKRKR
ncbi:hypothetical protein SARC_08753 [Sphaeroforma arctica JP610]|uniref:BRCT domain-containing protein n=1 Tax=Sphaeroforma arctica JP610 TaxID=667725 RepID=A0A0L0FQK7_9EUKA|nr:hypothetical protein SARC_08753 [Sphaeroforma arctica JP610]KNC78826.1 hypothetical protein SARC_08753 [Sphaeroforma arctica JP610]|eukprot:XP_014152728.1 hypothetical protein SARC_08753 [Sphaeroforma arctica JP610]